MKKMLSLILALVVLCVPMTFANAITTDEEAFLKEINRYQSSYASYYNIDGKGISGSYLYSYGYGDIYSVVDDFDWIDDMNRYSNVGDWIKSNPEKLADCAADLKAVNDRWDAHAAEKGYVMFIDVYDMYYYNTRIYFYYDGETLKNLEDFLGNSIDTEALNKIENNSYNKLEDISARAMEDPYSVTQEEFDEAFKDCYNFYYKIIDCFEGRHISVEYTDFGNGTHKTDCAFCKTVDIVEEHTFGEYGSDGNATIEADGTKTAKCEKCSATDTVTDEGSKLPHVENKEENKDIFTKFIEAIKNFFNQIADFFRNLFNF